MHPISSSSAGGMFTSMTQGVFGGGGEDGRRSDLGGEDGKSGVATRSRQRRGSTISGLSTLPETTKVAVECHVNVAHQCLDLVVRTNNNRAFVHAVIAVQGDAGDSSLSTKKKKNKKKNKGKDKGGTGASEGGASGGGGLFPHGRTSHVVHAMRTAGQALTLPLLPQEQRGSGESSKRERERDAELGYEKPVHTHSAALIRLQCLISPRAAVVRFADTIFPSACLLP